MKRRSSKHQPWSSDRLETRTTEGITMAVLPTLEQWRALQAYEEPGVPEYDLGA